MTTPNASRSTDSTAAPPGENPGVWHIVPDARPLVALCGYRFTDDDSDLGGPGGSSPGARCIVCDDLDDLEES